MYLQEAFEAKQDARVKKSSERVGGRNTPPSPPTYSAISTDLPGDMR